MINISKATKLKHLILRDGSLLRGCKWAIATLETILPDHRDLQQVTIRVPPPPASTYSGKERHVIEMVEAASPGVRWSDLDRVLIGFWESRSIRSKVTYFPKRTEKGRIGLHTCCR